MRILAALALSLSLIAAAPAAGQSPQQKEAARYSRVIDALLQTARTELVELSQLESVKGDGTENAAACNDELNARTVPARYTTIGAADLEGDLYCLNPRATTAVSIADRAYYLRAIGTRGLGVGDYQIGRQTGIQSLGLGYPVIDGADVVGVVISPLALSFLDEHLTGKFNAKKAEDLLVIDDHGTELARVGNRTGRTGRNRGGERLVKAVLRRDRGRGRFRGSDYSWTTVPLSHGAIHVAVGASH